MVSGRYLVSGKRTISGVKPGGVVEVELTPGALDALLSSGNLSEIPEQEEASDPSEPVAKKARSRKPLPDNEPSDGRPKPHEE